MLRMSLNRPTTGRTNGGGRELVTLGIRHNEDRTMPANTKKGGGKIVATGPTKEQGITGGSVAFKWS